MLKNFLKLYFLHLWKTASVSYSKTDHDATFMRLKRDYMGNDQLLPAYFIPKDADLLRNRKVNTKKRQNRHLPELAFLILGTYFTAPFFYFRKKEDAYGRKSGSDGSR